MRRTGIDGEGRSVEANQASSLSGSGTRRPDPVIPFPRRPDPPSVLLAETSPPEVSAPFVPLSVPVAAVVLRLRTRYPKLKVLRASDREE